MRRKPLKRLSGAFTFLPVRTEIYSCRGPGGNARLQTALHLAHQVVKTPERIFLLKKKKRRRKKRHLRQMFANCQEALGCSLVRLGEGILAPACHKSMFKLFPSAASNDWIECHTSVHAGSTRGHDLKTIKKNAIQFQWKTLWRKMNCTPMLLACTSKIKAQT